MSMRSFEEFEEAHDMRMVHRTETIGRFSTRRGPDVQGHPGYGGYIFHGPRATQRARAFGEIVGTCARWVERRPGLAGWVRVKPVVEVGSDFIAWEFAPSGVSLRSFVDRGESDEASTDIPPGMPLFLEIAAFFLSDDEDMVVNDPARYEEEKEAWRSPGGYDAEQQRFEIVRQLLRESLHKDSGVTSPVRSARGDEWEIHTLPITQELADRWAELSGYYGHG